MKQFTKKERYELTYLQTGKSKDEIAALLLLEIKILNKFSFSEFIMVQRTNITKKAAYYCKNAE